MVGTTIDVVGGVVGATVVGAAGVVGAWVVVGAAVVVVAWVGGTVVALRVVVLVPCHQSRSRSDAAGRPNGAFFPMA